LTLEDLILQIKQAALGSLQELAVRNVSRAEICFDLGRNVKHGLLESQEKWRHDTHQSTTFVEEGSPHEDQSSTFEQMPEHCVYAWDSGGGNPTLRGYGSRCTLIDEIRSDPAISLISTIVVLMASAIFSIVRAFFLGM